MPNVNEMSKVMEGVLSGYRTNLSTTNKILEQNVKELTNLMTPKNTVGFYEAIRNNQLIKTLPEDAVRFMKPAVK